MGFPYTFPFYFFTPNYFRREWVYQVCDASGDVLRYLSNVWNGKLNEELNAPRELSFSISAEHDAISTVQGGNEIWLRDTEDTLIGRFKINEINQTNSDDGPIYEVLAYDYLSQLADEYVFSYSGTTEAISTIVANLFDLQENGNPLTVGTIDSEIGDLTRSLKVDDPTTLLQQLKAIEQSVPFYTRMYVNEDLELNWEKLTTTPTGHELRLGRNLSSIERNVSYADQATRLYVFGANDGGKNVNLSSAAGQSENYLDSPLAQYQFSRTITIDKDSSDISALGNTDAVFQFSLTSDSHLKNHVVGDGANVIFTDSDYSNLTSNVFFYPDSGTLNANVICNVSGVLDTTLHMFYGVS